MITDGDTAAAFFVAFFIAFVAAFGALARPAGFAGCTPLTPEFLALASALDARRGLPVSLILSIVVIARQVRDVPCPVVRVMARYCLSTIYIAASHGKHQLCHAPALSKNACKND